MQKNNKYIIKYTNCMYALYILGINIFLKKETVYIMLQ